MFNNSSVNIERLNRQKEEIDNLIKTYQSINTQPINNFITSQIPKDFVEWRVLNENEEVDNLYVSNNTLFINDSLMILKGVDGSLTKWEVKKIYPIDKKDEKISQLENEIKKLKEMINNEEYTKSISSNENSTESETNVDGDVKSESTTNSVDVSK